MEILLRLRLRLRRSDERSEGSLRAMPCGILAPAILPGRATHITRAASTAVILRTIVAMALMGIATAAASDTISVEGNRRIDAAAIRQHFLSGRHGPESEPAFSPAVLDAALKELYATGQFEDVQIVRTDSGLTVKVVEAPVVGRLQFEGNKQFKDNDLTRELALSPGSPLTKAAVQSEVAHLVDLYQHAGRYDVKITPKTVAHGEQRVDLVFEIAEGAKTGVKLITFSGNHAYSDYRLKSVIKTTESGWFAFLRTSDVYDQDRIEADDELIRRFYLKNGFVDVRVSGGGVYDPEQKGFVINFVIDEGDRYRLGAVDIVSHMPSLDTVPLRGALHLAPGNVYDYAAIEKAGDAVAVAAAKGGAPFVAVRSRVTRNVATKTVDLAFVLDEGPHVYIERIAIRGNNATREEVIRREFDIAEGDAYNPNEIARAERRLKALRLFKSVKTATVPGSAPDRVVLNVDVVEDKTGDFAISGGYSTVDGIIGEITVSEQNFMGTGQYVKVTGTLGQYLRGGSISVVEPYFLVDRMSLGLDLSYKEQLTNSYQSYGSTTYGGTVKLTSPVTDDISTQARYSLTNQSLSLAPVLMDCSPTNPPPGCLANGEASAVVKQAALNGPYWTSSVGSSVIYNTLDNQKNPHDGVRAQFNQDVAGFGGDVDYLKSTGDVRYYHDLGNDIVAMGRAQGGYITPYGGQTLPLMSGFFGGPQLVRGFAPNGFGPRDITPGTTQDNVGGSAYWATSAELQAPILGLPPEVPLKVAGFADAGSVWGYKGATSFPALSPSLTLADSNQIRSSIGAGLIWDSPFGAMRIDYAMPVTKAPYDVTQRLHFGVGPF
jgi:outer membrane protein insertion porin family